MKACVDCGGDAMHEPWCRGLKRQLMEMVILELSQAVLDRDYSREEELRLGMNKAWGKGVAAFDGAVYGNN